MEIGETDRPVNEESLKAAAQVYAHAAAGDDAVAVVSVVFTKPGRRDVTVSHIFDKFEREFRKAPTFSTQMTLLGIAADAILHTAKTAITSEGPNLTIADLLDVLANLQRLEDHARASRGH